MPSQIDNLYGRWSEYLIHVAISTLNYKVGRIPQMKQMIPKELYTITMNEKGKHKKNALATYKTEYCDAKCVDELKEGIRSKGL